jgi:hypothetical protein
VKPLSEHKYLIFRYYQYCTKILFSGTKANFVAGPHEYSWYCRSRGTILKLTMISRIVSHRKFVQPLLGVLRYSSSLTVQGKATPAGTLQFVAKSRIQLHHQFEVSKLIINPIIHGAPKRKSTSKSSVPYVEALLKKALLLNKSNCVVAYQHYESGDPWYSTNLSALLSNPATKIAREEIVVLANLGSVHFARDIKDRLANAKKLTGINFIDMAIMEVFVNKAR